MAWIQLRTASSSSDGKRREVEKLNSAPFGSLISSLFSPASRAENAKKKQAFENSVKAHPCDINTHHHPYAFIRSALSTTAGTIANTGVGFTPSAKVAATSAAAASTTSASYLISVANASDNNESAMVVAKEVQLPEQMMRWLGWVDGMEVELQPLSANDLQVLAIGSALIEVDLDSYAGRCDFPLTADELSRLVRAEFAGFAVNTSQMLIYDARNHKGQATDGPGFMHSLLSRQAPQQPSTLLTLAVLQLHTRSPTNPVQLTEGFFGVLRDDTHLQFTLAEGSRLKLSGAMELGSSSRSEPSHGGAGDDGKVVAKEKGARVKKSSSSAIKPPCRRCVHRHATKLTTPTTDGLAGASSGPVKKPITLELMTDYEISTAGLYHLFGESSGLGAIASSSKKGSSVQQYRVLVNAEDFDTIANGKNVTLTIGDHSSGGAGAQQSGSDATDGEGPDEPPVIVYAAAGNYSRVPRGKIALHDDYVQKLFGTGYNDDEGVGLESAAIVQMSVYKCKDAEMVISEVRLELGDKNAAATGSVTYVNVDSVRKNFLDRNKGLYFNVGEELVINYADEFVKHSNAYRSIDSHGGSSSQRRVKARVADLKLVSAQEGKDGPNCGVLKSTSRVTFSTTKGTEVELYGKDQEAVQLFDDSWDFQSMGIGGLDAEFADIFRRAFASRLCPRHVVEKLGSNHVRGLLLHGPPGTGKTLIARKLAERLRSRPPKIVNGPEVFSMWLGQSEEHVRKLFEDAEREYQAVGDKSRLHVIIFDEFDAIAPNRANIGSSSRTNQKVVNQLLSKMDGVSQLNNILVIGMTNQKKLIDPALLRPGRMEIQLEIALPDDAGRLQILNIHTERMRTNDMLDAGLDLQHVARRAVNYSGAELEGLVRAAQSLALERLMKMGKEEGAESTESFKLTMEDFELALKKDMKPAFGSSIEDLQLAIPHGIIHWHEEIASILDTGTKLVQQTRSGASGFARLLLVGERRAGTTALAAQIAISSQMGFIRMVTPHSLCDGEQRKSGEDLLQTVFDDAYKSPEACVILDAFECLVSLTPGNSQRWDVAVSQKIQLLLEKRPPENKKLFIIVTSSCDAFVKQMKLHASFDAVCTVPSLTNNSHVEAVADGSGMFTEEELAELRPAIAHRLTPNFELGVKKLLELVDFASQAPEGERVKALAKLLDESQLERRMDMRFLNMYL